MNIYEDLYLKGQVYMNIEIANRLVELRKKNNLSQEQEKKGAHHHD